MDTVVACPTSDKAAGRIKLSQLKGSARAAANNGLVPAMSALGQSRPVRASNGSVHARYALKADLPLPIDGAALHIIQAPKREPRMMRYELTDYEWAAIRPMLPNKARARGRSARPQRHLLGAAIRRTMARSAGLLWPMHHLLQPFRPMAKGRSMGPDHGLTCCRS
jgi:hypothetical protein